MSGFIMSSSEDRDAFSEGYYESVRAVAVFPIKPVVGYKEFGAVLDEGLIFLRGH